MALLCAQRWHDSLMKYDQLQQSQEQASAAMRWHHPLSAAVYLFIQTRSHANIVRMC